MIGLLRRLLLVAPLALAIGGPFIALSDTTKPVREKITGWFSTTGSAAIDAGAQIDPITGRPMGAGQTGSSRLSERPAIDLRMILRFDVTPAWVVANWPHVATTRGDSRFDGMRVPLVTGTRPHDVAGSLTYYFDKRKTVQRIAVQGLTGDSRNLVGMVTHYYHLAREPMAGSEVYLAKWNGRPTSALWVHRAAVVRSDDVNHQFEFALELNRPSNYFGLSADFRQFLQRAQAQKASTQQLR